MRENVQVKGRRYAAEGRLTIEHVSGDTILAHCRGGGSTYALSFVESEWACSCPALTTCAHLVALQLVTSLKDS